jgi:LDH2 family malate/lactate/ureidoglycolate dehydrogenase
VLDMATGVVSMGRILNHARRGVPLEEGWALDAAGEPTLDAEAALRGAISPFGGAKGYGLGLALEVLVASLTASALGTDVAGTLDTERASNKGDLFVCIDPVLLQGGDPAAVSRYLDDVRASEPATGATAVRVPGDRAAADRERRLAEGVEIADATWREALELAAQGGERSRDSIASPAGMQARTPAQ